MRTLFENRASVVLYNFLSSNNISGKFLIPANVCPVVPLTFIKARIPFELVDISMADLCMQQNQVLSLLGKAPSYCGVLFVRTYGSIRPLRSFFLKIKETFPDAIVIDDRCQADPEFTIPSMDGSDLILFSTGYSKYIDINWGGFGFMSEKFKYQRNLLPFKEQDLVSLNNYLKEAIAKKSLTHHLEDFHWMDTSFPRKNFSDYKTMVLNKKKLTYKHKTMINSYYRKNLPKEIQLADDFQHWRFNILVKNKDELLKKIFDSNLFASSHFASLAGIISPGKAENAEKFHSEVINLFNDFYFDMNKAEMITDIILEHISNTKS